MSLKVDFVQSNYFGPNTVIQSVIKEEKQHTHVRNSRCKNNTGPETVTWIIQLKGAVAVNKKKGKKKIKKQKEKDKEKKSELKK